MSQQTLQTTWNSNTSCNARPLRLTLQQGGGADRQTGEQGQDHLTLNLLPSSKSGERPAGQTKEKGGS